MSDNDMYHPISDDIPDERQLQENEDNPIEVVQGAYLDRKYFKRYLTMSLNNLAWALAKVALVQDNFIKELEKNQASGIPIREDYREIFEALTLIIGSINQIGFLIVEINNKI